jgi:uncharacterized iron-regulated membrane protein
VFPLHRYLGLAVGLLLIIVGITGSVLMFQREIDRAIVAHQFRTVVPQEDRGAIASVSLGRAIAGRESEGRSRDDFIPQQIHSVDA